MTIRNLGQLKIMNVKDWRYSVGLVMYMWDGCHIHTQVTKTTTG